MRDDGVAVWCFAGKEMWGLTDDDSGQVLPVELGPWIFKKTISITGSDPDEAQALQLIRDHGFCCFDPEPTEETDL